MFTAVKYISKFSVKQLETEQQGTCAIECRVHTDSPSVFTL